MVTDCLKYASDYFNLGPGIRRALEYLQQADMEALGPGRHDLDGDRVFVLISDYDTRSPSEAFWEAHRQHIDVQYVHEGMERIGYGDLSTFEQEPYDEARDLVVARGHSGRFVELGAGDFAILFPHDVHMPGLTGTGVQKVRKAVVKVRV